MTQDHPSKLSFSIEESVWLNKGQEIQEVLSMSLDPEISIEEKDEHVYIRGGLQLIGEYRPAQKNEDLKLEEGSIRDQVAFRSIEEVTLSEDGIEEIRHYFPIDVTIPINRIKNLEDVYVQVETFDYDLPERSCIQLTADVSISGMSSSQETTGAVPLTEESIDVPTAEPVVAEASEEERQVPFNDVPTSFAFEARKAPEPKPEQETVQGRIELANNEDKEELAAIEQEIEETQLAPISETMAEKESAPKYNFSPSIGRPEIKGNDTSLTSLIKEEQVAATEDPKAAKELAEIRMEEEAQPQQEEQPLNAAEEKAVQQEPIETKINIAPLKKIAEPTPEPVTSENTPRDEEEIEESSEKERPKYSSKQEENALYLTSMLTDGKEQFTRLKICIIQENESLDMIADRYEVSTSQLLRVNRLNQE